MIKNIVTGISHIEAKRRVRWMEIDAKQVQNKIFLLLLSLSSQNGSL